MSISSDVTKQSLSQLQAGTDLQSNARDFKDVQRKEAQVVNELADINANEEQKQSLGSDLEEKKGYEAQLDEPKADEVNQKMRQLNVSLSFELSEDGSDNIVKVVDRDTGELVRQIPSEEFLKISKRIDDIFAEVSDLKGSLVNSEV